MTGRENLSIWHDLKRGYPILFFIKILILIPPLHSILRKLYKPNTQFGTGGIGHWGPRWRHRISYYISSRHLIIQDSFRTPFYKLIGCKLFSHKWISYDERWTVCVKCNKVETIEERKVNNRLEKLEKLI